MYRIPISRMAFAGVLAIVLISADGLAVTNGELADIVEAMEGTLRDVQVEYDLWFEPAVSLDEPSDANRVQIGGEHRVWATSRPFEDNSISIEIALYKDKSGKPLESVRKRVYTDKQKAWVQTNTNLDTKRQSHKGGITKNRDVTVPDISSTPQYFTTFGQYVSKEWPLAKLLRQDEWVKVDNTVQVINGFNTIRADLCRHGYRNASGEPVAVDRIYFAVDYGYTPVRFEKMQGKEIRTWATRVDVTELAKVAEGLWYPKSGSRSYAKDTRHSGMRTLFYKASVIKVNRGLSQEIFDLEFPAGTKVTDEILNKEYVIRPSEKQFKE